MTKAGFTYRGVHSSQFGVYCNTSSRVLAPQPNRSSVTVPGRHGAFDQSDGTWAPRQEEISFFWIVPSGYNRKQLLRDVAGWLCYPGELVFDSEPNMRYRGTFTSSPPLEQHMHFGSFSMTFEANPPFAYEPPQNLYFTVTNQTPIRIQTKGTVQTPVRLTIKNTGTTTIRTLTIERRATTV
jgi:predicted phage tail component-like protein